MNMVTLLVALLLSASADPNSSELTTDNAPIDRASTITGSVSGTPDDQIGALQPVLAPSNEVSVIHGELLLKCIINYSKLDLNLASSICKMSKMCFELIKKPLAELWQLELQRPSSDMNYLRTVEEIISQSELLFDPESFLVAIFDDEAASLVMRRLLFVAVFFPNTVVSILEVIGGIPSVNRLISCWVVLFHDMHTSDDYEAEQPALWICSKILKTTQASFKSDLINEIPADILDTVKEYQQKRITDGLRPHLPKPFSKVSHWELTDVQRQISERHQHYIRELPNLASVLFFFGTPFNLDKFELHKFTDSELKPVLQFCVNAPKALSSQIVRLNEENRHDLILSIIQSESFLRVDGDFQNSYNNQVTMAIKNLKDQPDLIKALDEILVELEETISADLLDKTDNLQHVLNEISLILEMAKDVADEETLQTAKLTLQDFVRNHSGLDDERTASTNKLDKAKDFRDALDVIETLFMDLDDGEAPQKLVQIGDLLHEASERQKGGLDNKKTAMILAQARERIADPGPDLNETEIGKLYA